MMERPTRDGLSANSTDSQAPLGSGFGYRTTAREVTGTLAHAG